MEIDDLGVDAQNALLSQLVETSPSVLWVFTADWDELVYVNERYMDIWGRDVADLEVDSTDFLEGIHPDDREDVQAAMAEITAGNAVEIEYRVNPTENFRRWVHVHGKPLRDDTGDIAYVAGFAREITEEKTQKQELERKNERLESFASVVSHDLRNPLNVAAGNLELVREECDSDRLETIERALGRMDDLIENLLELARDENAIDPRPLSLADVATDCWADVVTGDASLHVETDAVIEADPGRLKQLFENLYRNSVEHGSTNPRSRAHEDSVEHGSTDNRDASRLDDTVQHGGSDVTVRVTELEAGDGFAVADDGPGIPAEDQPRVFESGYSTTDGGTGLGLAIVAEIATSHDWDIGVTEDDRGGARFEFSNVDVRSAAGQ